MTAMDTCLSSAAPAATCCRNAASQFSYIVSRCRQSLSSTPSASHYIQIAAAAAANYIEEQALITIFLSMSSQQQKKTDLDAKARQGETVVPGGTGGKSLEAQQHLAEGRSRGGQTRKEQLGTEGYQEMGRKGGLSTGDKSGGERAEEEGIEIDEDKFKTKT